MNGNAQGVTITGKAAAKLRELAAAENRQAVSLRIAAVRTRCMGGRGYTYSLEMEDSPAANDELSEHDGTKGGVDPARSRPGSGFCTLRPAGRDHRGPALFRCLLEPGLFPAKALGDRGDLARGHQHRRRTAGRIPHRAVVLPEKAAAVLAIRGYPGA